jgi:hypothetical protein
VAHQEPQDGRKRINRKRKDRESIKQKNNHTTKNSMISKATIKNLFCNNKKHQRFGVEEKNSKVAKNSFKHQKLDDEMEEESSKKKTISFRRKYQEL